MSLWKSRPKCCPTYFFVKINTNVAGPWKKEAQILQSLNHNPKLRIAQSGHPDWEGEIQRKGNKSNLPARSAFKFSNAWLNFYGFGCGYRPSMRIYGWNWSLQAQYWQNQSMIWFGSFQCILEFCTFYRLCFIGMYYIGEHLCIYYGQGNIFMRLD
jgi:hypothetical protein